MAKGGGGGTSTTTNNIPPELSKLYSDTAWRISEEAQAQNPIHQYLGRNPTQVAGLSGTQQKSIGGVNRNLDAAMAPLSSSEMVQAGNHFFNTGSLNNPLDQSEIVQAGNRYFDSSIAPQVESEAVLSGLGRSTALNNARSAAEAQVMLPLLQGEQGRRDQIRRDMLGIYGNEQARRDQLLQTGMQAGDVERSIEQEGYNAEAQDALRRQGLAEQSLFGVMGQLPSTVGQTVKSKSSGSGLFK